MSELVETKEYQDLWHKMTKEIAKLKELYYDLSKLKNYSEWN